MSEGIKAKESENDNLEDNGSEFQDDDDEFQSGFNDGGGLGDSSFDGMPGDFDKPDANVVKFQIENEDYVQEFERMLRGEIKIKDKYGNETIGLPRVYNADGSYEIDYGKKLLNDYGVNEIISLVKTYSDKSLTLSIYDERRINEILYLLHRDVRYFMLTNADVIGLDTHKKETINSVNHHENHEHGGKFL